MKLGLARREVDYYVKWLQSMAHLVPECERQWWLNYLDRHKGHYASVVSRLQPPESCGPVLEIGSAPGHLTLMLVKMGYHVSGVDINVSRFSNLWESAGIDIRQVNIETDKLPFNDGEFSVVLLTEVLEHLRVNPLFALAEARRVTRTAGELILSVPNITPRDRFKFLLGRDYQGDVVEEFGKLKKFGYMGHIRLYSSSEVLRILQHTGYECIHFRREGRVKGSGFWRFLNCVCSNAFRSNLYFMAKRPTARQH